MPAAVRLLLLLGLTAGLGVAEPVLTVAGPERTLILSAAEFAALPRTECTATDPHAKTEHRYAGVLVRELLTRVGAPLGKQLRGSALQLAVVVRARDGYDVVLALADFDEDFGNRTILLADQEDGQRLGGVAAPLQLIVSGDKRAARWVRMVCSLEIGRVGATAPASAAKP